MAINLNESRLDKKREALLDPAYTGALERGMVMVYSTAVDASGAQTVTPAVGSTTEVVAGLLWLSETTQASVPVIQDATIPLVSPLTVSLQFTPIGLTNIRIIRTDTLAELTVVAGAPGAGQVGITGKVLTGDAALAGVAIEVTYRYTITAQDLARRGGRRSVNQGGERTYNQVTLCYGLMRVMTSNFDVDVKWSGDPTAAENTARTGSASSTAGQVTTGGANTIVGTVFQTPVIKLTPGIEQAFLGLEMSIK